MNQKLIARKAQLEREIPALEFSMNSMFDADKKKAHRELGHMRGMLRGINHELRMTAKIDFNNINGKD